MTLSMVAPAVLWVMILGLIGLVLVGLFVLRRAGRTGAAPLPGRLRSPKRFLVLRLVAAGLGLLLLAAFAWATWRHVEPEAARTRAATQPAVVLAPARTLAEQFPNLPPDQSRPVTAARLLVSLIATMNLTETAQLIVQQQIDWSDGGAGSAPGPEAQPARPAGPKPVHFSHDFDFAGATIRVNATVENLEVRSRTPGRPALAGSVATRMTYRSGSGSGSSSGTLRLDDGLAVVGRVHVWDSVGRSLLRLRPDLDEIRRIPVLLQVDLLGEGGAVQARPEQVLDRAMRRQANFLSPPNGQTNQGAAWDGLLETSQRLWMTRRAVDAPAGGSLSQALGTWVILLLLAGVLLAQPFRRRLLACCAILPLIVLYVAGLDRLALEHNLARMGDATAPTAARVIACIRAAETFFFAPTAATKMEAVLADPATPAPLRMFAMIHAPLLRRTPQSHSPFGLSPEEVRQTIVLVDPGGSGVATLTLYAGPPGGEVRLITVSPGQPDHRLDRKGMWWVVPEMVRASGIGPGRIVLIGPNLEMRPLGGQAEFLEIARLREDSGRIMKTRTWTEVVAPALREAATAP